MELQEILRKINICLDKLYSESPSLFTRHSREALCERCLVFRFAHYIQEEFYEYFVDCDFNGAIIGGKEVNGKPIQNEDGTFSERLIDIIVHKRNKDVDTDFICFELKKWNNYNGRKKDRNNLKVLTITYRYKFGFHIILGKTRNKTKIMIFENGREIQTN